MTTSSTATLSKIVTEGQLWCSDYKTLLCLLDLYPSIIEVLKYVEKEREKDVQQRQTSGLQIYFISLEFVFYLHLMLYILRLTNVLSQALQRKDQDVFNVISLVESTKRQLQNFRVDGWVFLLKKVFSFFDKYDIGKLDMTETCVNSKNQRNILESPMSIIIF